MWHAEQKVVCIDDVFPNVIADWCEALPVCGRIYTVRDVCDAPDFTTSAIGIGLLLEELVNPLNGYGLEARFSAHRFAPLETHRRTSSFESNIPAAAIAQAATRT